MNALATKTKQNVVPKNRSTKPVGNKPYLTIADNRAETVIQQKLQRMANNGGQVQNAVQLYSMANNLLTNTVQKKDAEEEEPLQGKFKTIQKQELEEEELLQGKFNPAQKKEIEEEEPLQGKFTTIQKQGLEEEELLQGKFITTQRKGEEEEELLQGKFEPIQKKENNTGLPDNLKSGIENLSGVGMDDVKVHYNSDKPSTLQAHAFAQGTDIHVAPGQEKHLPHEAWHVVQQKQGRVKPTMQMKGSVNVNDDAGLEKEADVMGEKSFNTGKDLSLQRIKADYNQPGAVQTVHKLQQVTQRQNNLLIQKTSWWWVDGNWEIADDGEVDSPQPERPGAFDYETVDTAPSGEQEEAHDKYAVSETLKDGTIIDYPALTQVMNKLTIGERVGPKVWRKMREKLSDAIALPNKSHPAHGSNFNDPQRPEQQIADWAKPMQGELKIKLASYFSDKYKVDI